MSPRQIRTFRTAGLVLVIALVAGIVLEFAIPLLVLALGIWAALGLWLGERARMIRRRNST
jgi:hypothetical protein